VAVCLLGVGQVAMPALVAKRIGFNLTLQTSSCLLSVHQNEIDFPKGTDLHLLADCYATFALDGIIVTFTSGVSQRRSFSGPFDSPWLYFSSSA
jgi:hypothetical protein